MLRPVYIGDGQTHHGTVGAGWREPVLGQLLASRDGPSSGRGAVLVDVKDDAAHQVLACAPEKMLANVGVSDSSLGPELTSSELSVVAKGLPT